MANCYYSGAGNAGLCYDLYNKNRLSADIEVIHNAVNETIAHYGQKVEYYVNTYSPLCADNTYGEQPASVYWGPKQIKILSEVNESALSLSKWGFNADDEVTGYISIRQFSELLSGDYIHDRLSQEVAPKAGDVFQLTEYGNDRFGTRNGNFFQITERRDQDVSAGMNPLGGHFMWRIKAKRLQYSFEPGLSKEAGNDQVYDNTFAGVVTSTYSDDIYDYIPTGLIVSTQTLSTSVQEELDNQISVLPLIRDTEDYVNG